MSETVGVKNGELQVVNTPAATTTNQANAPPSTQIIRGGLRRILIPLGVTLLRGAGVQHGDAFILVVDNDRTSVACLLGAMEMHCVCVLLSQSRIALLQGIMQSTKIPTIITVDDDHECVLVDKKEQQDAEEDDARCRMAPPLWLTNEGIQAEGCVGMLTSGSVADPKVVACTWASMRHQGQCTCDNLFPDRPARIVCATSISHAYSINALFTLLMSPHDVESELCFARSGSLALQELLSRRSDRFTLLHGTPATYVKLLKLDAVPLFVDVPYCAGTRLSQKVYHQMEEHSGMRLMQNYGSSETGNIAAWGLHGRTVNEEVTLMTSQSVCYVGTLWPGVHVHVEETGEVLVRTPWQAMGYVVDGRLESMKQKPHRTADRGNVVKDDREVSGLWLDGRIRREVAVIKNGLKVLLEPTQIELAFVEHADVTDALALMQGKSMGNSIMCVVRVVLRDRTTAEATELKRWGATRLGVSDAHLEVEVVPFLPCSPAGKLIYR